jgi:peptidoglycan/LPS O-acetylase OafA/YrhL
MLLQIDYSKRVFGLDVMRAIAIIIVVMTHGAFIRGDLFSFIPKIPLIDGVELFFVLSGFLIGGMLLRQVENEKFGIQQLWKFLKRRWFRTLPNYYLILIVNIFLVKYQFIDGKLEDFNWTFFLFLQNFHEGFVGFYWESWSLSIEEWFYIFLPFLLLILSNFLKLRTAFFVTTILLIVLPLIYRFMISGQELDGFWWDVNFRKVVLTRLDAIGFGVLMSYINHYFPKFFMKIRFLSFVLGIVIILVLIYLPREPNDLFSKTVYFSFISIGAALLLPLANSMRSFKYKFWGIGITHISILSYAMYLVNLSLVASVFAKHVLITRRLENLVYYSLYWLAVLIISYLIYRFYEKPITDLRDKL